MRELTEVRAIPTHIDEVEVDALESQDPDFKEWPVADRHAIRLAVDMAALPPYTISAGAGTVRRGKDCVPLTGDPRDRLMVERGESDVTTPIVPESVESLLSPAALERLRDMARQEQAPADMLRKSDGGAARGSAPNTSAQCRPKKRRTHDDPTQTCQRKTDQRTTGSSRIQVGKLRG